MPHNAVLIANPTSGSFSRKTVDRAMEMLAAGGIATELRLTASADDPARFAREACRAGRDPLVIVAGGDGTLNGALNGLDPGVATLAVLPLGTANVLARELAIRSLDDAVSRVIRGATRPLTVGTASSNGAQRHFLLMAGIGVDGAVVTGVRTGEKRLLGQGAYFLSALRTLRAWERDLFEVTIDGRTLLCHTAIVCNAASYAGDFRLAPEADISSPDLQVVCMQERSRGAYLRLFRDMCCGHDAAACGARVVRGREIAVSGCKPVQLDGDPFSAAPLRITATANFARLVV
jgi:YegS/Rv2252/BmrU family lipid kinase